MKSRAEAVTGTRVGARRLPSARSIAARDVVGVAAEARERARVDLAGGLGDRGVELRVRAVVDAHAAAAVAPNSVRIRPGSTQMTSIPKRRDLHPQRVAHRLDRVLGRVVGAAARERQPPAHRGDVDDLARARRAHPRQHELGAAAARRTRWSRTGAAPTPSAASRARPDWRVAGVVDQHVDAALDGVDGGRIDASSVTSSASVRHPAASSSASVSDRRAVAYTVQPPGARAAARWRARCRSSSP